MLHVQNGEINAYSNVWRCSRDHLHVTSNTYDGKRVNLNVSIIMEKRYGQVCSTQKRCVPFPRALLDLKDVALYETLSESKEKTRKLTIIQLILDLYSISTVQKVRHFLSNIIFTPLIIPDMCLLDDLIS